jgi:hypothetical protein
MDYSFENMFVNIHEKKHYTNESHTQKQFTEYTFIYLQFLIVLLHKWKRS